MKMRAAHGVRTPFDQDNIESGLIRIALQDGHLGSRQRLFPLKLVRQLVGQGGRIEISFWRREQRTKEQNKTQGPVLEHGILLDTEYSELEIDRKSTRLNSSHMSI